MAGTSDLDVAYVARLARINLTEDEAKIFQKQLGDVLKYVEKLREPNVTGMDASSRNTLKTGSACAAASMPVTSSWRSFSTYLRTSSSCFWKIFASSSVRLIRASLATYATSRSEVPAISGAQGCKWLMSNMTATPKAAKRIRKTIRPCRRSLRIARGRRPFRSASNTCGASIAIET